MVVRALGQHDIFAENESLVFVASERGEGAAAEVLHKEGNLLILPVMSSGAVIDDLVLVSRLVWMRESGNGTGGG